MLFLIIYSTYCISLFALPHLFALLFNTELDEIEYGDICFVVLDSHMDIADIFEEITSDFDNYVLDEVEGYQLGPHSTSDHTQAPSSNPCANPYHLNPLSEDDQSISRLPQTSVINDKPQTLFSASEIPDIYHDAYLTGQLALINENPLYSFINRIPPDILKSFFASRATSTIHLSSPYELFQDLLNYLPHLWRFYCFFPPIPPKYPPRTPKQISNEHKAILEILRRKTFSPLRIIRESNNYDTKIRKFFPYKRKASNELTRLRSGLLGWPNCVFREYGWNSVPASSSFFMPELRSTSKTISFIPTTNSLQIPSRSIYLPAENSVDKPTSKTRNDLSNQEKMSMKRKRGITPGSNPKIRRYHITSSSRSNTTKQQDVFISDDGEKRQAKRRKLSERQCSSSPSSRADIFGAIIASFAEERNGRALPVQSYSNHKSKKRSRAVSSSSPANPVEQPGNGGHEDEGGIRKRRKGSNDTADCVPEMPSSSDTHKTPQSFKAGLPELSRSPSAEQEEMLVTPPQPASSEMSERLEIATPTRAGVPAIPPSPTVSKKRKRPLPLALDEPSNSNRANPTPFFSLPTLTRTDSNRSIRGTSIDIFTRSPTTALFRDNSPRPRGESAGWRLRTETREARAIRKSNRDRRLISKLYIAPPFVPNQFTTILHARRLDLIGLLTRKLSLFPVSADRISLIPPPTPIPSPPLPPAPISPLVPDPLVSKRALNLETLKSFPRKLHRNEPVDLLNTYTYLQSLSDLQRSNCISFSELDCRATWRSKAKSRAENSRREEQAVERYEDDAEWELALQSMAGDSGTSSPTRRRKRSRKQAVKTQEPTGRTSEAGPSTLTPGLKDLAHVDFDSTERLDSPIHILEKPPPSLTSQEGIVDKLEPGETSLQHSEKNTRIPIDTSPDEVSTVDKTPLLADTPLSSPTDAWFLSTRSPANQPIAETQLSCEDQAETSIRSVRPSPPATESLLPPEDQPPMSNGSASASCPSTDEIPDRPSPPPDTTLAESDKTIPNAIINSDQASSVPEDVVSSEGIQTARDSPAKDSPARDTPARDTPARDTSVNADPRPCLPELVPLSASPFTISQPTRPFSAPNEEAVLSDLTSNISHATPVQVDPRNQFTFSFPKSSVVPVSVPSKVIASTLTAIPSAFGDTGSFPALTSTTVTETDVSVSAVDRSVRSASSTLPGSSKAFHRAVSRATSASKLARGRLRGAAARRGLPNHSVLKSTSTVLDVPPSTGHGGELGRQMEMDLQEQDVREEPFEVTMSEDDLLVRQNSPVIPPPHLTAQLQVSGPAIGVHPISHVGPQRQGYHYLPGFSLQSPVRSEPRADVDMVMEDVVETPPVFRRPITEQNSLSIFDRRMSSRRPQPTRSTVAATSQIRAPAISQLSPTVSGEEIEMIEDDDLTPGWSAAVSQQFRGPEFCASRFSQALPTGASVINIERVNEDSEMLNIGCDPITPPSFIEHESPTVIPSASIPSVALVKSPSSGLNEKEDLSRVPPPKIGMCYREYIFYDLDQEEAREKAEDNDASEDEMEEIVTPLRDAAPPPIQVPDMEKQTCTMMVTFSLLRIAEIPPEAGVFKPSIVVSSPHPSMSKVVNTVSDESEINAPPHIPGGSDNQIEWDTTLMPKESAAPIVAEAKEPETTDEPKGVITQPSIGEYADELEDLNMLASVAADHHEREASTVVQTNISEDEKERRFSWEEKGKGKAVIDDEPLDHQVNDSTADDQTTASAYPSYPLDIYYNRSVATYHPSPPVHPIGENLIALSFTPEHVDTNEVDQEIMSVNGIFPSDHGGACLSCSSSVEIDPKIPAPFTIEDAQNPCYTRYPQDGYSVSPDDKLNDPSNLPISYELTTGNLGSISVETQGSLPSSLTLNPPSLLDSPPPVQALDGESDFIPNAKSSKQRVAAFIESAASSKSISSKRPVKASSKAAEAPNRKLERLISPILTLDQLQEFDEEIDLTPYRGVSEDHRPMPSPSAMPFQKQRSQKATLSTLAPLILTPAFMPVMGPTRSSQISFPASSTRNEDASGDSDAWNYKVSGQAARREKEKAKEEDLKGRTDLPLITQLPHSLMSQSVPTTGKDQVGTLMVRKVSNLPSRARQAIHLTQPSAVDNSAESFESTGMELPPYSETELDLTTLTALAEMAVGNFQIVSETPVFDISLFPCDDDQVPDILVKNVWAVPLCNPAPWQGGDQRWYIDHQQWLDSWGTLDLEDGGISIN
ncbi:uncharacterized protein IL334_000178 [Kwoniella shivajii]|uniref:Uncharacterized protein n=1 Tax=Kwoniella shivajii TaxID=564305 RepID=A0ABZ1CPZ1_9TREE|nr:hypothetical protein IL334_000178 [Kwoniella shivajii]